MSTFWNDECVQHLVNLDLLLIALISARVFPSHRSRRQNVKGEVLGFRTRTRGSDQVSAFLLSAWQMFARRIKEGIARGDCTAVHRVLQQVSRHIVLEESGEIHKVHARSNIDANQYVFRHRRIITYMRIAPQNVSTKN